MLYTIAVILIVLWVIGFATSYTLGGVIHILLVIAVIMIIFQLIRGRRALWPFVRKMRTVLVFVSTVDGKVTKWGKSNVRLWSSQEDQKYFKKIWDDSSLLIMGSNFAIEEKLDINLQLIKCEKVNTRGTLITKYAVLKK